jgi:DNA-binding PadR family transcriptional regulator
LALEHLRESLTRNNLWIYVLSALEEGPASPGEIRKKVQARHDFAPAAITFYTVLYKLRKEGLVQRKSDEFRSAYEVTAAGRAELAKAGELLERVRKSVSRP